MSNQEAQIDALKQCIRELINSGTSLSAWYHMDHPKRLQWHDAVARASLLVPLVDQYQSNKNNS